MTLRERIADWISGGMLTFYKSGWERSSALAQDRNSSSWQAEALRHYEDCLRLNVDLRAIAALETPHANATVRKMARIAREAVK